MKLTLKSPKDEVEVEAVEEAEAKEEVEAETEEVALHHTTLKAMPSTTSGQETLRVLKTMLLQFYKNSKWKSKRSLTTKR
jgi:hypothetical protein